MAAAVLQPAVEHHARMQVHSFKGDQDMLVDRLIAASQRREVAFENLQERPLVPYFDSSDASATTLQALQPAGRRGAPSSRSVAVPAAGLKRHVHDRSSGHLASSPPKKESEVVQAKHQRRGGKQPSQPATSAASANSHHTSRSAGSGSGSDVEMSSPPVQRKPRSNGKKYQRQEAAAKAAPATQRQSPPRKRAEPAPDMRTLAAASAAAGAALRTPGNRGGKAQQALPVASKFAGPAFTNSPTPDCLPIPTSSLLLQEAADGLRSRLNL